MKPVLTPQVIAKWTRGTWAPRPPPSMALGAPSIRGVSHDTRTIERGNLYFALRGANFDGHQFVENAFRAGACAAVVSRHCNLPTSTDRLFLYVDDPALALKDTAAGYRATLDSTFIGVTGSAGKTTVKEMLADILETAGPAGRSIGNWNNNIGLPLSILRMEQSMRVGVFELGTNHPGEIAALCEVLRPTWGVVTNIGPVHTEFFKTVEAVANEKADLLRALPADGKAVLSKDCPFYSFLRVAGRCRTISVALGQEADYVCHGGNSSRGELVVLERATGEEFSVTSQLPGEHNVRNALLAIAAARQYGIGWEAIRSALERYKPMPFRWEQTVIGGITVINDAYNANPMSMRAAIETFRHVGIGGRKWLVLSDMLELGSSDKDEHLAIGRYLAHDDWAGLITVGELGSLIADGACGAGFDARRVIRCRDNRQAADTILHTAHEKDTVLLKGSRRMKLEEIVEYAKKMIR